MEIRRRSVERYILYYYFFNQLTTKKNLLHQVIDNVHPEKILNNTPTNFESKEEEKKNRPRRETGISSRNKNHTDSSVLLHQTNDPFTPAFPSQSGHTRPGSMNNRRKTEN